MANPIKQQIFTWIDSHREDIIDLLRTLVKIESPSGKEHNISQKLFDFYHELGYSPKKVSLSRDSMKSSKSYLESTEMGAPETFEGRSNIVVEINGVNKLNNKPRLILNAHMDTIPVPNPKTWKYLPFEGVVENNRMYGRGAADDKSGLVEAYIISRILKELNIQLKGTIVIQNTIEEEMGGNGTLQCVLSGQPADAAILLENVGKGLIVAAGRGVHLFELTIKGQAMMTEYMWESPNVIEQAVHVCEQLRIFNISRNTILSHHYYDMYPPEVPKVPLAVTVIQGGDFPTTIPGEVTIKGAMECLPNMNLKEMRVSLSNFLKKIVQTDPLLQSMKYKLSWFGLRMEGAETPEDHPIINILSKNNAEIKGMGSLIVGAGGSDLRLFVNEGKTPAVMYGPDSGNGHANDEWVDLNSIIECIKILILTVIDFCELA